MDGAVNDYKQLSFMIKQDGYLPVELGKLFNDNLLPKKRSLNIFTSTVFEAIQLQEEIKWFFPTININILPDWETLPYDEISPHPDLISQRLLTLYQMSLKMFDINILPIATCLHLLPPRNYIEKFSFLFTQGQSVNLDAFKSQLISAGYRYVDKVINHGEYAVRGGIIDLYPMGSSIPYRLDFFDDEIESIRTFDVDTQRSLYPVKEISLLPARECRLDEEGIRTFRENYRENFEGDPSKSRIYKTISDGIPFSGMEWYLPLFYDDCDLIFTYLDSDDPIICLNNIQKSADDYWIESQNRFKLFAYDSERPILKPEKILITQDIFFKKLQHFKHVQHINRKDYFFENISIDRENQKPLEKLHEFILQRNKKTLICAEGLGRRETLSQLLEQNNFHFKKLDSWDQFNISTEHINLIVSPLHNGFETSDYLVITENEIFPNFVKQKKRSTRDKNFNSDAIVKDLTELDIGDPIVHEQHGVGRYQGLVDLDFGDGKSEFLLLHYDREDKLYVPVSQLHYISRYSGGPIETAPLHKLGSGSWEKAKKRALTQIHDTAAELLNLYSKRALKQGNQFSINLNDYERFAEGFPFEETPDQKEAIENVIKDMESKKPMDRLICGDVGFGKTEVALRAAFISAMNGKQVIILVPTTLLAEQHYNNFSDRFANWPIRVEEISRFKSKKQQKEILEQLETGHVDIVIGTHRLIQDDVKFKNVGLIIIDEEHRFGVRQKEKLKKFRTNVDVLTLTATPIPRTLSMAMEGLREFSIIATPPQKRLSIKTFVVNHSQGIIREAVLREFNRGGQVYYLHNEVNTIQSQYEKLSKLLPEARIGIAHGQLREKDLEHVMQDFHQQRINFLLCSTIIETGIDIPTANTIVINRADKFGLAQLHQLRGRVGRSHHQAYAYMLLDEDRKLSSQSKKRLEAIQLLEDLGSGYYLAIHDLEIRGAGELLGDNQSGQIHEIGFNLYIDMLNHAVRQLKMGKVLDLEDPIKANTDINLHAPTIITDDYVPNTNERLILYKRLSSCSNVDELKELEEEFIDRFGLIPEQTQNLIRLHKLRVLIKNYDIEKIDAGNFSIEITFNTRATVDPTKIIDLIQSDRSYKMNGPNRIKVIKSISEFNKRVEFVEETIKNLH